MTKVLTPDQTMFESETCYRCSGTGRYSYNQVDGSRCYGCSGQGVRLTKRGAAANQRYKALMTRAASELKIGDTVKSSRMTSDARSTFSCWAEITDIKTDDRGSVHVETFNRRFGRHTVITGQTGSFQVKGTPEERTTARDAARSYQATLTKWGKPLKRAA